MADRLTAFERAFVGRPCTVTRRETDWVFSFGADTWLVVESPWRLVTATGIALTASDDQQVFGLGAPFNVEVQSNGLFEGKTVASLSVDRITADIRVAFDDDLRLDVLHDSSGYEGWQGGSRSLSIVALGGGGLQIT